MSLRTQAISGIRWTTASSIGRALLQFSQVVLLSRLLLPDDFGLVALAISIVTFLQIFADGGVSNAVIHQQDLLSAEQISSLYWFNVASSATLALLLALGSPLLSIWFGRSSLTPLLLLAAATLIVTAFAQQLKVQAQKRLDFQSLAKIELIAAVCGFCAAVVLAWHGAGAQSLMAGTLCTALTGTLLAWLMLANGWRPQLRLCFQEIRQFIRFGLYMIGNNLANTFNSQIDVFLGSKLLGASSVGLYSVPKELNLRVAGLINPIITQVAFPIMAKAQDDDVQLRRIYLQIMRMTASVNFPIYVFIGFFAKDIVALVLGPRWQDAVSLLRILSVWALIRSTSNPVGSLLMARGRADISFKWNIALLAVMPPAIWFGSRHGITGMGYAMTGVMVLAFWPNWRYQIWPLCGAGFVEYAWQMVLPLLTALATATLTFTAVLFIESSQTRLPAELILFTLIYTAITAKMNKDFFRNIRSLAREKS
ncbi:MAG TPA: MOP flippase family protein [Accumulibacter sp.]|uniref:MOP flippase family protein n=1 Tax=Accumulibacter sp. TaxID=2053492 RepID=UPI002BC9BCB0|nr:MOP flippase family protein [Accumulibacter sp.]HMW54781.1 MOP flippase family protein [Accumulibacter sp.]HNG77947.1 MOP flippase family protein [Burkholderiaceae bacterium]